MKYKEFDTVRYNDRCAIAMKDGEIYFLRKQKHPKGFDTLIHEWLEKEIKLQKEARKGAKIFHARLKEKGINLCEKA